MGDKTCVTCAHGAVGKVHCEDGQHLITTGHGPTDTAYGAYADRADSVEQVAREMLHELTLLGELVGDGSAAAIAGSHRAGFADRLRALGVIA